MIRIAGGQGMYGDHVASIRGLLDSGVDYLCLEALAELTLAILQKDRQRDPELGFTKDLGAYLAIALPHVASGRTKVITNAGGINVVAAAKLAAGVARKAGVKGIRIATVTGDDVSSRLAGFLEAGQTLANLETGAPWSSRTGDVLFANAYLGAAPIVDALAQGANIVITGRVADASLFLAPQMHAFGWKADDWDRLAAGTVVGHLSECAGQSTGGNFSGEWWTVPEPSRFAYPIAECDEDGTAVLTKAAGTGGRVDFDTVRHQLLYEVHDPSRYLTPDVTADFTSVRLDDLGGDRVRISGARGHAAPAALKVLACSPEGFSGEARVAFSWPDAHAKATMAAQIFRRRVDAAGHRVEAWHEEYWGVNALHGSTVPHGDAAEAPEVALRIAWRCADAVTAAKVGRELAPLALSAPPSGMTTFGRSMAQPPFELLGIWPMLVDRALVEPHVRVTIEDV